MTLALWIEYPPDPKELLLVWQAPPSVPDRLLWAVGRIWKVGDEAVFDYLGGEEFAALNLGRSPEDLRAAGYSGYPAFDIRKRPPIGFRDRVLEAFLRRLPPATRADFSSYLAHYHMRMTARMSPFALLAVTEARLPSDGFSLIDPLDASAYCVDFVFEIADFKHDKNAEIKIGDSLELEPESLNKSDRQAVRLKADGRSIGYVNRLQSKVIREWLDQREIRCWITRLNGSPDSTRAYAFLRVRSLETSVAA